MAFARVAEQIGAVNLNLQYARLLSVGVKWLVIAPAGTAPARSIQSVMAHVEVDGAGEVVESEISATGNSALNESAVDLGSGSRKGKLGLATRDRSASCI